MAPAADFERKSKTKKVRIWRIREIVIDKDAPWYFPLREQRDVERRTLQTPNPNKEGAEVMVNKDLVFTAPASAEPDSVGVGPCYDIQTQQSRTQPCDKSERSETA